MVLAAAVIAAPPAAYSGNAIFSGAFASPLPAPAFDLDFDMSTRTLWGISNVSAQGEIRHFDLSGRLIGGFTGQGDWNSTGIAVDPGGKRIYYWQNLGRDLQEAAYPDGAFLRTTTLPWGHQNSSSIDFDMLTGSVVLAKRQLGPDSSGVHAFTFIEPGVGVVGSADVDTIGVGYVAGFEITADSYWLLGPRSWNSFDEIVRIDRRTGRFAEAYPLPGAAQTHTGLALDESTGTFYVNSWADQTVQAFEIRPLVPEPGSAVMLLGGGLALLLASRRRRP